MHCRPGALTGRLFQQATRRCVGEGELVFGLTKHAKYLESGAGMSTWRFCAFLARLGRRGGFFNGLGEGNRILVTVQSYDWATSHSGTMCSMEHGPFRNLKSVIVESGGNCGFNQKRVG